MDSTYTLELSPDQLNLVHEGLRYVRSARKLAFRDPLAEADPQRESDLQQVGQLIERLIGVPQAARARAAT